MQKRKKYTVLSNFISREDTGGLNREYVPQIPSVS